MFKEIALAIYFVATCAIPTGVSAQNVYKCGNTYSQTPCPDARVLNVDDARTPVQQKQTADAARSDKTQADALEKERLAQEKQAAAQARQAAKDRQMPTQAVKPVAAADAPLTKITPKRHRPKTTKPWNFIAEVPGSEKNAPVKKTGQKKASANP